MSDRPNDARAPYLRIAGALEQRIAEGEWEPGDQLPTTRELTAEFGVSPMTIQSALRVLREKGLVVGYQGRGTFVRESDTSEPGPGLPSEEVLDNRRLTAEVRQLNSRLSELEGRLGAES